MPCEINRINSIEHNLKNNPKMMSTTDLLYYLECNTNNKNVNSEEYFKKINSSFFFEDIFVNTSLKVKYTLSSNVNFFKLLSL